MPKSNKKTELYKTVAISVLSALIVTLIVAVVAFVAGMRYQSNQHVAVNEAVKTVIDEATTEKATVKK